jgi:Ras family protein T1
VELTPAGLEFFADIFNLHDKDQDGALSPEELSDLFSTSPGNPWLRDGFPATTVTNDQGNVTLQGWLAQWAMTTLLNHRITLAYLAYLGFQSSSHPAVSTASALQVTASRKSERKTGKSKRQVFTALLLGAAGSGKSTLMRSFVGQSVRHVPYEPTSRQSCVVNAVEIGGVEKYLVLMEYGREEPEILRSPKKLAGIDVVVFVYDSADTNSFSCVSSSALEVDTD